MSRPRSLVLGLACLLGLLFVPLAGPPAGAAEVTANDDRGDAPARHDITRVSLRNDPDRVSALVRFSNLRRGEQIVSLSLASVRAELYWTAKTVVHRNGRVTARLETFDGSEFEVVRCNVVAVWRFTADAVRLSYPQSCMDIHRGLRVQTNVGAGDGTAGDPSDWTRPVRVPYS